MNETMYSMEEDDFKKLDSLASDAIRQIVTQVLTLSTALIAAAVGFAKFLPFDNVPVVPLLCGAICFALSIIFGVGCLMAIASTLANGSFDVARNRWVKGSAVCHLLGFLLGILCLLWLAFSLSAHPGHNDVLERDDYKRYIPSVS